MITFGERSPDNNGVFGWKMKIRNMNNKGEIDIGDEQVYEAYTDS